MVKNMKQLLIGIQQVEWETHFRRGQNGSAKIFPEMNRTLNENKDVDIGCVNETIVSGLWLTVEAVE